MPTATAPPYFLQNPLLPPDEKRAKKVKLALFGCLLLLLLFIAGIVWAIIHFFSS